MANILVWAFLLLSATVLWENRAVSISSDIVTAVECTSDESIITLNLAGRDPRPTVAIINGNTTEESCNHSISNSGDTVNVTVSFSTCGIQISNKTFELYIVQQPKYLSENDTVVRITCTDVKIGMVEQTASVNKPFGGSHSGENQATAEPSKFTMAFESSGAQRDTVEIGTMITLKLTSPANVRFDVIRCTVESLDAGYKLLGPHEIIDGWCSTDKELLSNFRLDNAGKIATSTVKAFRLVGQGRARSLTFKCQLKWCSTLLSSSCVQQDNSRCEESSRNNRRRRRANYGYGAYTNDQTLTASLRVNIPGINTSGTSDIAPNGYIVKLAILVLCSLRCIL